MIELTEKQIESYNESDALLNIWEGAVRSGKTFVCIMRFIKFIRYGSPGECMIVGCTEDSLRRNIIGPMQTLLGDDLAYKKGYRQIRLWNRIIHIVGANDERAVKKIQGSTLAGVLVDELTLLPENFFNMLRSRLSVDGAQLFATCNPDSPFHWLKTNWIDKADKNLKIFSFRLEDNNHLPPQYIEELKKDYSGMWYQRYIEGKWVLAEGVVFDMFDRNKHIIPSPPGLADYYVIGIDYGTVNPTAFSLIGYSERTQPRIWLEREYYWDSRKEMKQKTDTDYCDDLVQFCKKYHNIKAIYLDPSAASFKLELMRAGFTICDAKNDVLDGIRHHSMLLDNGTFKITSICKKAEEEYGTYHWDTNAQKRGEDKPLKEHDHMMDAIRYGLYSHFFLAGGNRMKPEDLDRIRSEAWGIEERDHGKFFEDRLWG